MDKGGAWFAYEKDPIVGAVAWVGWTAGSCLQLKSVFLDIQLPTCTDWKESKIINPNLGKS